MDTSTLNRRQTLVRGAGISVALGSSPFLGRSGTTFSRLDALALEAIAAGASPGLQVAISRDGTLAYSRGFGVANLETDTAVGSDTVFRIASLSKQFTAAAVWRLSAAGALSVQDPVSRFLPFMGTVAPMSLLELMTQVAGVRSDEIENSPPPTAEPVTQVELARRIAGQSQVLDFPPGTAWFYSNANYIVLGGVIEAVTGKPYGEAMADLVFRPLDLSATAVDRSGEVVSHRASGYSPREDGAAFDNASYIEIGEAGGAGAIRSTASELCRWSHGLFSNRLFSRDILGQMTAPGRLRDGRLSGDHRFSADDVGYGEVQYASGLLVSPPNETLVSYLHYGGINGFCSMLETWPEHGVTLAVLCNADRGPATPFRPIRQWVQAQLREGRL